MKTEVTRQDIEELLGEPISDRQWDFIVTHNRQQEAIDMINSDRSEPSGG